MKIIAGVHHGLRRHDAHRRPRGALPLGPRCARRRHRHGAPGTEHRPRPHGRRERLPRRPAGQPRWASSTGAAWRARPREQLRRLGIDVDPTHAHRRAADRPPAARSRSRACCSPAPASSSSTSRPPRCRRRRSSGCSACCAGCARTARSIIFISHFLDDILRHLRRGHDLPQRPEDRRPADGRRASTRPGHRAHDRPGPRGARGELSRRDHARQPAGRAGGAGGRAA